MRKFDKACLLVIMIIGFSVNTFSQQSFFRNANEDAMKANSTGKRVIIPQKYRTVSLDLPAIKNFLWSLPSEQDVNRLMAPILALPMPDGSTGRFRVWESSIQESGLEAKFPEIRTFAGQGIDDPYASIRFDYNPYFGFSAQILSPNGRIYIDPYARWDINNYISYYQKDNKRRSAFICSVDDNLDDTPILNAGPCLGTQLRTYRLAVACTGEYSQSVAGGVPAATHAAIVTSTNRITGVYEVELSIRLVLIANNNLIEYTNGATDPYNNVISSAELNNNQNNITAVIGSANYDIGHLFTSDDNGLAGVGVVCNSTNKARGATGSPSLIGDGFDIDYVAHEMGHQFGAGHTFNSSTCASAGGSIEPGGGTTIMAYAGICDAAENIQPNSDPIFHALSFDQIGVFVTTGGGASCAVLTPTGNTVPSITAVSNNGASIPINTPFTLTGTATDANGDAISYNWEGWDVGPAGTWVTAASSTTRPLFRTRVSKTTGERTFPDIRVIAANYPGTSAPSVMDGLRGEVLPTVARAMKFRLTVRDNRAGGGGVTSSGEGCQTGTTFQINAVGTTPFSVTVPNGGESYAGGTTQTVTWNNAGTTAAPFNVSNVKISYSTDGGLTFPTVLAASTANDGSEMLTIPAGSTTTARIKIESVGNIFFDISNTNFTVTAAPSGTFDFGSPANATVTCGTANNAATTLNTVSNGGYNVPIDLVATGNPAGTTVSYSVNPVTPGNSTIVTLNNVNTLAPGTYPLTVTGTSGAVVRTATLTYVVSPGTGPVISAQPTATPICDGSNISISVSATGASSYQWQLSPTGTGGPWTSVSDGGVYSGATTNALTITGATTALSGSAYRVVLPGLCGTTNSNAATLTVNALPATNAVASPTSLCIGETATLTASGADTYTWSAGTTPTSGPVVTVMPGGTTTYTVTGTITATGCTKAADVTVTAKPKPTITLTASPYTSLYPGLRTTLSVGITPVVASNNIVWYKNGIVVPGASGSTMDVTVDDLGIYSVSVTSPFNCPGESSTLTITDSVSNRLFISPNPNNGQFKIRFHTWYQNYGFLRTVLIYDSKGSIAYKKRIPITAPYSAMDVDMRSCGKGIYSVVLADYQGKPLAHGKVIIQ